MAPLTPNYKAGVGQLVTYRSDFQTHIDGYGFNHNAIGIELNPSLTINSLVKTNVQDALAELATITSPPVITDATSLVKGVIQLTGDLGGTAASPRVTRLQTYPISALPPVLNDVLIWNGAQYSPGPPNNVFTPAGDLTGNNVSQQVVSITGTAGTAKVNCNNITFDDALIPVISQENTSSNAGATLKVQAQSATGFNGGKLSLLGGSGVLAGGVALGTTLANNVIEISSFSNTRNVVSLANSGAALTAVNMPLNTGDYVVFVADCVTAPTIGLPVGGTILYSDAGTLNIKQGDGSQFKIGELSNPNTFGTTSTRVDKIEKLQTTGASPQTTYFGLPANGAYQLEIKLLGKKVGAQDVMSMVIRADIYTTGVAPIILNYQVVEDNRAGNAFAWTDPALSIFFGLVLQFDTGYNALTTINWSIFSSLYSGND